MDNLRISVTEAPVEIKNTNPIFKGTSLAKLNFCFRIFIPTRSKIRQLRKSCTVDNAFDRDQYFGLLFLNQVVGWEIEGDGGIAFPFTKDNRIALSEKYPKFTSLIAMAILSSELDSLSVVEEETKNLSASGVGG